MRTAGVIGALLTIGPALAHAATFGEVVGLSPIGSPLHVEIRTRGTPPDITCLRLATAAPQNDDLPWVRRARIALAGSGANTRIVVSAPEAVFDPVIRLGLENLCNEHLRRDYTLLLPAHPELRTETATAPAANAAVARPSPAASERTWITAPGESLDTLAHALYPNDSAARSRFRRATARANPTLFPEAASYRQPLPAGTELRIPDLQQRPPTPRPATQATASPPPPPARATTRPPVPQPAVAAQDRVELVPDGAARPSSPRTVAEHEQQLAAAIDRTTISQMELLARIAELEAIQAQLTERVARLAQPPESAPPPAAPPAPSAQPQPAAADRAGWLLSALLAAIALVLGALLGRRTRSPAAPASLPTAAAPAAVMPTPASEPPPPPPGDDTTPEPVELPLSHIGGVEPLPWDGTQPSQDARALATLAAEEEVEEHDSAIELAEIMMSFGRVHGAAETLADFIRHNPRQAVTPWLKLLDVYRAAGLRAEFDGLARQLNKNFNVKAVTWANFDAARNAPHSLEQMPHILAALQQQWGTRDCQRYLQRLLRDNRDGTREGFPLAVIDEILLLAAVLEQQLGPYRPQPEDEEPETVTDNGPATLP